MVLVSRRNKIYSVQELQILMVLQSSIVGNRSVVKETPTLILIPIANFGFHVLMSHVTMKDHLG
jgi:hypothetical protein